MIMQSNCNLQNLSAWFPKQGSDMNLLSNHDSIDICTAAVVIQEKHDICNLPESEDSWMIS